MVFVGAVCDFQIVHQQLLVLLKPASYTHATQDGIASALYITITLGCPRRPIRLNIMTFREPNRQIDQ
jgi:hypothetical protein